MQSLTSHPFLIVIGKQSFKQKPKITPIKSNYSPAAPSSIRLGPSSFLTATSNVNKRRPAELIFETDDQSGHQSASGGSDYIYDSIDELIADQEKNGATKHTAAVIAANGGKLAYALDGHTVQPIHTHVSLHGPDTDSGSALAAQISQQYELSSLVSGNGNPNGNNYRPQAPGKQQKNDRELLNSIYGFASKADPATGPPTPMPIVSGAASGPSAQGRPLILEVRENGQGSILHTGSGNSLLQPIAAPETNGSTNIDDDPLANIHLPSFINAIQPILAASSSASSSSLDTVSTTSSAASVPSSLDGHSGQMVIVGQNPVETQRR